MDESSEMIYDKEIYYSTDIIKAFLKNEKEEVIATFMKLKNSKIRVPPKKRRFRTSSLCNMSTANEY
ncbi:hypothetical protein ACS0PU_002370 [Formica fusca]